MMLRVGSNRGVAISPDPRDIPGLSLFLREPLCAVPSIRERGWPLPVSQKSPRFYESRGSDCHLSQTLFQKRTMHKRQVLSLFSRPGLLPPFLGGLALFLNQSESIPVNLFPSAKTSPLPAFSSSVNHLEGHNYHFLNTFSNTENWRNNRVLEEQVTRGIHIAVAGPIPPLTFFLIYH